MNINPVNVILNQMMSIPKLRNNPMAQNAMQMLQNGNTQDLQIMAENICKERGIPVEETRKKALEMLNH